MGAIYTVGAGLVGVIVTALFTYLSTRRSTSGNLEASKAEDLWTSMRGELERYQVEATALRTEMATARVEMVQLREEAALSRTEIALARVHVADLEETSEELKQKLAECLDHEKAITPKKRAPRGRLATNE